VAHYCTKAVKAKRKSLDSVRAIALRIIRAGRDRSFYPWTSKRGAEYGGSQGTAWGSSAGACRICSGFRVAGQQPGNCLDREATRPGKSLRQIAAILNDRGIKPKRGKRWVHSSVLRIVKRKAA
jgi:hypothetical protein